MAHKKSHRKILDAKKIERKQAKMLVLQKKIAIFSLLVLLVLGLVSTTFASFVVDDNTDAGSLVVQVENSQRAKQDLADTKANIDVAQTSANLKCVFIYDNSKTNWNKVYLMVGHGSYSSAGYQMTKITNTNLYYYNMSSQWSGATEMLVMDTYWGSEDSSLTHRSGYMSGVQNSAVYKNFGNMTSGIQLLTGSSGSDGFTLNSTYCSASTNAVLNPTQKAFIYANSTYGGTSYSANASSGTVEVSGYYLSDYKTAATRSAASALGSSSEVSASLARTSTVTMKATPTENYTFAGWYDGTASSATCLSTSTTYTYTATDSNVEVYARFNLKQLYANGETIYFDARSATGWASSIPYVQLNGDTTSGGTRIQMTKIGSYLYRYTFTSSTGGKTSVVRFWSGTTYYTAQLPRSTYNTYNGIFASTAQTNNDGELKLFKLSSITTPTCTVASTDILLGESVKITCSTASMKYTVSGTQYSTTPAGAKYDIVANGTTLQNTTTRTYTWTPTQCGVYTVTTQISSTTAGLSSEVSAAKTVTVRPADPTELNFTGNRIISGTGTESDPFIVIKGEGFSVTADIGTPATEGAVGHYSTTAGGTYSQTDTFSPSTTTVYTPQTYTLYAKAYSNGIYSTNYISDTAYYRAFTRLDGTKSSFTISATEIEDDESITLSGANITGIQDIEYNCISYKYQVSTDGINYTDIDSNIWSPNSIGTYHFRLVTTNTVTGDTVYSLSKQLIVNQSTTFYTINVVNDGSVNGTVTLKTGNTTITNNMIQSNSDLLVSLTRPSSNYYVEYLKVNGVTVYSNKNSDIAQFEAIDFVKDNVVINYKINAKPKATVVKPANTDSISFVYYLDSTVKSVSAAGDYYVDYNTNIKYTVVPSSNYFVSAFTGVTLNSNSSWSSTESVGSKAGVKSDLTVSATISVNNTVTVNVDNTSFSTTNAKIHVGDALAEFSKGVSLNYGVETTIKITPPANTYALVNGVSSDINTDGVATFKVTLTGENQTYTVKFVENPKIYMAQPEYGSVYVSSGSGKDTVYYFNGDYVGYGTKLTVYAKVDHINATLNNVLVNNASIGTSDGATFNIYSDSTASAGITVADNFAFTTIPYDGYRRVLYTDSATWGDGNVRVYYSNKANDTDFTQSNYVVMTQKYKNDYGEYVYYSDIPLSAKYVTFVNGANPAQYSKQATIDSDNNAFYIANSGNYPRAISDWQYIYSDYIASDRADSIQQASTSKNEPVTFAYSSDYGDSVLSAEVVVGDGIEYTFSDKVFTVTPTTSDIGYSLIKITSSASQCVKYYLIRVDDFEIVEYSGLQKIYNDKTTNSITLYTLLGGGMRSYSAEYFISSNNVDFASLGTVDAFTEIIENNSLARYLNAFTLNYSISEISGVRYYKVKATDSASHSATKTLRTLFGTNKYYGNRAIYLYNDTNVNVNKYDLRVCFFDDNDNKIWTAFQRVGDSNYYRVTVPCGYVSANIYRAKTNRYSTDLEQMITTTYSTHVVQGVTIPEVDNANIVFNVSDIGSNGIVGSFTDFN